MNKDFQFAGIRLGDTESRVRNKLDCLQSKYTQFSLVKIEPASTVESFFVEDHAYQYALNSDELYLRFVMDSDQQLRTIIIAIINDRTVC